MKFWRMWALLATLATVILASLYLGQRAKADKAWIEYQYQLAVNNSNVALWEKMKKELQGQVGVLQGEVDSLYTVISEKEETIAGKEADIGALKRLRPLLSDKDQIIANLDSQVNQYDKLVFTLKEKSKLQDDVIFNLTKQGQLKDQMLQGEEDRARAEKELRLSAERGWSLEKVQTQILRKQGRWSRALVLGSLSMAGASQIHGTSFGTSALVGGGVSILTYLLWK